MVHEKDISSTFDGEGARIAGERWNSKGNVMVYTAGSLSPALLGIVGSAKTARRFSVFRVRVYRMNPTIFSIHSISLFQK